MRKSFLNLIEEQLFNLNLEKDTIEIPVINKEPQNIDIEKSMMKYIKRHKMHI